MNDIGRLRWRCRRGMKELDLVLLRFLEQDYPGLDPRQQADFARLLALQDPELWAYLTGRDDPKDAGLADIIQRMRGPAQPAS